MVYICFRDSRRMPRCTAHAHKLGDFTDIFVQKDLTIYKYIIIYIDVGQAVRRKQEARIVTAVDSIWAFVSRQHGVHLIVMDFLFFYRCKEPEDWWLGLRNTCSQIIERPSICTVRYLFHYSLLIFYSLSTVPKFLLPVCQWYSLSS